MGRDLALGGQDGQTTASVRDCGVAGGTPPSGRKKGRPAAGLSAAAMEEFERTWHRYETPLLAYARKRIPRGFRGVLGPEDTVQDAFFAAFMKWEHFDADGARRSLMAIARNQIANAVKAQRTARRGRGQMATTGTLGDGEAFALVGHSVQGRAPVQCAIDHDDEASLKLWISHLPPERQRAILLHFIEGQGIQAVAAAMGRSAGSIHMLCSRALRAMRAESCAGA